MSTVESNSADTALLGVLLRRGTVDTGLVRHELGTQERAVRAGIARLIELGCEVDQAGLSTYRLSDVGLGLWQDYLAGALPTEGLPPMLVRVYRQTTSTQDVARTLAPRRALVLADHQTAGRGRLGRRWLSSPGTCALMSLVWPADPASLSHDRVSMLVGVAVARALERLVPHASLQLKWPNDVMAGRRKLAGILIEAARGAFVIGVGINVTPDPQLDHALDRRTTNLASLGGRAHRLLVVQEVVAEIARTLVAPHPRLMLDEWRARAALGHDQAFHHDRQHITGTVLDLDPDAGLIVRQHSGEIVTLPAATTSVSG